VARAGGALAETVLWHEPCSFAAMNYIENTNEPAVESNLAKGVLGALLGAAVGVAVMFGFYELAGFRFPLLGVGTGFLTGLGAKWFFRGGDNTLGLIAGGIALSAVVATLYMMYGAFPILNLVSVVVGASVAYRLACS
jgi:hypothetical protein